MLDIEAIKEQIGDVGNNMHAIKKGKLRADVVQADRSKKTKVLSPIKYSKNENLLSLTAELSVGAKLSSSSNNDIQLTYISG